MKRKFQLIRIYINRQGYDSNGQYWGTGNPLYCASDDESQMIFRARDRVHAKECVRAEYSKDEISFFN